MVRPGLAIFGASPVKGKSAQELNLKPVMTLQTNVIAVRNFMQGDSIGYGCQYICEENMPVGIIAIGYGDGYPRTASNGTPVLINDTKCYIIGRVSMDMIAVDLRNAPSTRVGDYAVLWGSGLPIEDISLHTKNISYDMLCGVQNRVKFYWTS
jgi:alanine racemase